MKNKDKDHFQLQPIYSKNPGGYLQYSFPQPIEQIHHSQIVYRIFQLRNLRLLNLNFHR